jgi:hypothetical protein
MRPAKTRRAPAPADAADHLARKRRLVDRLRDRKSKTERTEMRSVYCAAQPPGGSETDKPAIKHRPKRQQEATAMNKDST